MKAAAWFVASLSTMFLCAWIVTRLTFAISMDINCTGHIKRAADANTIDLAIQELKIAVDYLESRHLTSGSTAILFHTPDADVDFWYKNLKASLNELQNSNPNASNLEKSNMLIKLRETLLDHGEKGESITRPPAISVFPYNLLFCVWEILAWFAVIVSFCFVAVAYWDKIGF
jgi:hypothetical protein